MNMHKKHFFSHLPWESGCDYLFITIGTLLQAFAIRLFLVPGNLINSGVAGLAQLINHYTGFPIGVTILIGNIPLLLLGWRHLGGKRFAVRTAYAVVSVFFLPIS